MNTHSLDLEAGSSQYTYIADGSQTGLDITGDFTFEYWVKWESIPTAGNIMFIFCKDNSPGSKGYQQYLANDGGTYKLKSYLYQDNTTYDQIDFTITAPTLDIWYHYAVTCDISNGASTELELFINGVSQGNGSVINDGSITSIQNSTGDFYIGAAGTTGATGILYLDGKIDDIKISNTIRTSFNLTSEINPDANHMAYWKFNNSALDETANNNDLTLVGSPSYSIDVPFVGAFGGNPLFFSGGIAVG